VLFFKRHILNIYLQRERSF